MAYFEGDLPITVGNGNCNNNGDMFSGGWGGLIGLVAVAALFGWGNGGGLFGGNRGGGVGAEVQRGFDTQSIISKLDGINTGLCDGFYAMNTSLLTGFGNTNTAIMQNGYETRSAINDLGYRMQDCCCRTQAAIEGVNTNIYKSTCDITNAINGSTQQILGFLTQEKISALQSENAALTAQLSQNAQTQTLINTLRPCPQPAYITCSPFESAYGFGRSGNNCGCGCNG